MIADSYMLGALASKALSAPLRNEADAGCVRNIEMVCELSTVSDSEFVLAHPYRSPQAELSPLQDASFFQDYINGALIALIAYEHIITFDAEIRVIWGRRRTLPAILFVINRYNLLLDAIVLLQIYLRLDLTTFTALQALNDISIIVAYCVTAALLAFRMYALYDKNSRIFCLVLILSLAPAITTAICVVSAHKSSWLAHLLRGSPRGCNFELTMTAELHQTLAWAGRLPTLLGDVLVLALTWAKTAAQVRATRRLRLRSPLYALFLRDGTLYFVALAALNASQLVLDRVLCLSQVIFTLTAVLVSRFLLNLRRADDQHAPAAAISSLRFAGGIESLVRPLAGGGEEGEERYECVDDAMHGDVRASGSIEEIGLKIEEASRHGFPGRAA